jgi:restriction system protein
MGRRKGELTLLMEVASKWPWKVSAAVAPISFVVCHLIAAASAYTAAPADLAGLGPVVIRQGIHAFATLLQYVFPIIFLAAAVVSFVRRSRSIALFDDVRRAPTANIAALTWHDFEALVGEGFRHRGFEVTERGGAAPDGGVDLALARGHERFLVQCKQWRAQQVTVSVVRELYGVMAAERVAGGYVVTSGTFTKDAKEFAEGRNIELMDGKALEALLRDGRSAAPAVAMAKDGVDGNDYHMDVVTDGVRKANRSRAAGSPVPGECMDARTARPSENTAPTCPKCTTPMVARTAKNGKNVGGSFWGWARYPKCRHTVAMG